MKEYIKPEIEVVDFAAEAIADQGNVSGGGGIGLNGIEEL